MVGRLPAEDVHRALPQRRALGAHGHRHPLGSGPCLVDARPGRLAHLYPVNALQLTGQQIGTPVRPLVGQANRSGQQGHERRGMVAVLPSGVDGHGLGGGHIRASEQALDLRFACQQSLGVPDVELLDEGPEHQ
jgi:hypothetical protein